MIIGFGFGPPLVSILMLIVTAALSYGLYRLFSGRSRGSQDPERRREQLRQYYYEQRELARRLSREFDLTDEEIERRIDEELNRRRP
jgi:flagellar basal body-associated protein FliL